ncbi:hypothetical protein CLU79DRAFT_733942 [Phycomyces nitens]|nr:hypothetical protein CLU79DRAFT_733942 [Phycomyces nitens]
MMTTQTIWDVLSTWIKYKEGFSAMPNGSIISKPFSQWTQSHRDSIPAMDYVECVTFSFHTGVFFLMQCFWNYLSNAVAKKSFMTSFEFRFYILWALLSMALFPILQWVYRGDEFYSEIVPQLAYGLEVILTALLGVRSHFRFSRMIGLATRTNNNATVISKLNYFRDMNFLLTTSLFSYGLSFVIICVDGLTTAKVINLSKFGIDALIVNANICTIFVWLLFISIFHPRRQFNTNNSSKNGEDSEYRFTENSKQEEALNGTNSRVSGRISTFMANNNNVDKNNGLDPQQFNPQAKGGYMRPMAPVAVDYPQSTAVDDNIVGSPGASARPLSPPGGRSVVIDVPYSDQSISFAMVDPSNVKRYPVKAGGNGPTSPVLSTAEYSNRSYTPTEIPLHDLVNRSQRTVGGVSTTVGQPSVDDFRQAYGLDERTTYEDPSRSSSPQTNRSQGAHPIQRRGMTSPLGSPVSPTWERDIYSSPLPPPPPPQGQVQGQSQGQVQDGERDHAVRDWLWQSPERRV